jgi:FAD/FMN-containing dehydrogenase
VKSGGHALFAGASNADGGITIDLRLLNEITILPRGERDEREVTRVGTGNRWSDVYSKLEPLRKTVVGGRNSNVGVGGFLLGGLSLLQFLPLPP